jgi:hypothetical protein
VATTINRDEWIAALGEAIKPTDPDALTIAEMAALFHVGRQGAYLRMARLIEEGRARQTWKFIGRRRVVAYVLIKSDKPAKPAKR